MLCNGPICLIRLLHLWKTENHVKTSLCILRIVRCFVTWINIIIQTIVIYLRTKCNPLHLIYTFWKHLIVIEKSGGEKKPAVVVFYFQNKHFTLSCITLATKNVYLSIQKASFAFKKDLKLLCSGD